MTKHRKPLVIDSPDAFTAAVEALANTQRIQDKARHNVNRKLTARKATKAKRKQRRKS